MPVIMKKKPDTHPPEPVGLAVTPPLVTEAKPALVGYGQEDLLKDVEKLAYIDAKLEAMQKLIAPLETKIKAIQEKHLGDMNDRDNTALRVSTYVEQSQSLQPGEKWWNMIGGHKVEVGGLTQKRSIKDIEVVYKHMGPEVFWKVCTVSIKSCDDYLTLPQKEEALNVGWTGHRKVKVTPSGSAL